MKYSIVIILLFSLAACSQDSSPEGRMTIKTDSIQKQLDSVKVQNKAILDSIRAISKEIKEIKEKK